MDEMSWRPSRRRPHSASGAIVESVSFAMPGSAEMRPPFREQSSSPELDFTDKLKALRELIASSKSHRQARKSPDKSSSRIMARRSAQNFCEARDEGEKLKFTATSFGRRELAERAARAGALSDKELIARGGAGRSLQSGNQFVSGESGGRVGYPDYECDHTLEPELLLDPTGQKCLPPRRHSAAESYSHLLSRDLQLMGLALEQGWLASDRSLAASLSPKRVTFRNDELADSRRTQASLGYYHHEVPERDWSTPARTLGSHAVSQLRGFPDSNEAAVRSYSAGRGHDLLPGASDVLSVSELKGRELMKEKEAIYKQYSPGEAYTGTSPPEHDYPSSGNAEKPIQTNVQISDKPEKVRARPRSADLTRRTSSGEVRSGSARTSPRDDGIDSGHWTQLLSQKRDKNASRSVPSSPSTVQSNVSLERAQRASPHTFLLREAAKQLEHQSVQAETATKEAKRKEAHSSQRKAAAENGGDVSHGPEEKLQDDEVADIFRHPRGKKKIIIKRGSVRVVLETKPDSQQVWQKISARQSSAEGRVPREVRSELALARQSSQDSDDSSVPDSTPVIAKDEHIMTLDKLKALLRGRRSESRPGSQTSSASMTSPSPMKAFHHSKHPHPHSHDSAATKSRRDSAGKDSGAEPLSRHEELAHGKARSGDAGGSKPLQRKVIKRPPSFPRSREGSLEKGLPNGDSSCPWSVKAGHVGADARSLSDALAHSKGDVRAQKPSEDRPSSAPQFPSRVSSPSGAGSVKLEGSAIRQGLGNGSSKKKPSSTGSEKADQRRRRPASSTDLTKGSGNKTADAQATAHSLRSSVQRLHQEVSRRVNQDAYIVQGLMNRADVPSGELGSLPNSHHSEVIQDAGSGHVCRRLSFDEDAAAAAAVEAKREAASGNSRSQSCIPFGKRLGAGMVDTGSVASGLDMGGLPHNGRASAAFWTTSGSKQRQTNISTNLDDAEDSFVANIRASRDLATSTPRADDRHQPAVSALASASPAPSQNGQSLGVRGRDSHSRDTNVLPERLASRSLQQKRPASVGAFPIWPGRGDDVWASGGARPFSWQSLEGVPSGDDAADLILSQLGNASMVHLLQQLYTADDATRQSIIIKAQYFKLWRTTAHSLKHQRQVYAESLQRAHKYLVSRLLRRCFLHWHTSADENRKNRMADGIHRQHMLRKGLQGFSWAIMRSKHQTRTLRMRVSAITIRAYFSKWQSCFESCREQRMRTAFVRWQEFAYEEKSVREMQREQNEKLVCQAMLVWKEAYDRRIKENVADKYLRRTSLRQSWRCWCHFTFSSKEKAHRHTLALGLRKRHMQRSTLHVWRVALYQSRRATQHFRIRRLQRTLQAWRHGAQISRVERQRDLSTSIEHWRHITTRHTFLRWHQQLHQRRATAMANHTLSRKTFDHWRRVWQTNTQRRQEVEAAITRSRLRKCLLTWRRNVIDRHRKQRQAVFLLEACLMRGSLLAWRQYTAHKTGFRASLQQHVRVIQCTVLSRCFCLWRELLHLRLDERRKRELWSLSCVRKMTAHWRHKCHIQRLDAMLEETEPVRELGLLKRMFGKWLAAKSRAEEENAEAVASRHILERCSLQRRFQEWRLATQRALTIRPLVVRRQRLLVTRCFDAWHQHIKSRLERRRCQKLFQKSQLSHVFSRWRRQYHCQQVSHLAHQSFMHRLALCLLQEWREILRRKHQARLYHCRNLLRHSFQHWHGRTLAQLRVKAEDQAEQELSQELKRHYFNRWWSGVRAQMADNNDAITRLQQRQNHNHIRSSFVSWRRSLHAHVITRAYQRSATQRLLRSILREWHEASSQSLCSAVQHFAQQLGLQQLQETGDASAEENSSALYHSLEFGDLLELGNGDWSGSPCSSSTTSVKRLFASDHSANSERVFSTDLDLDRTTLLNSGLLQTMEERRNKNIRLQELTLTFLTRLSHWPVSLAFGQWLDYTHRQRQLRQLAQEVEENHRALTVTLAFRLWRSHQANNQKATNMSNWRLKHSSLVALLEYSRRRKVKAALAERARGHLVKNVLGRIFPWWLAKAQDQRHQRTVLHLWTTATPEETQLLPLEASLSRRIRQRSLRVCLHAWRVRFLFLVKLKRVYHAQLLGRVLSTWQNWASLRQHRQSKAENFLRARRKNLAFRMWCERLHQKRETERRYQAALEGYKRLMFRCWHDWAAVSKQHRQSQRLLEVKVNLMCVKTHFVTWRRLAEHAGTIRAAHQVHLLHSVFTGWRQATLDGKQLRQTILSFQAASLTRSVGQLFHRWQLHYQQRQGLHVLREKRAQRSALHCGKEWRKKAQNTRGRKLIVVFKYSRLSRMFNHWRSALVRVEELKQRQADYMVQKNKELVRRLLGEWRQKLQSSLVARSFTHKLLLTVLHAWHVHAKASKERRIRGLALQHALQERNLRLYFVYWRHLSLRVRSLQNNVEVRLQMRVLHAWSYIVRRRSSQRRLGDKFARLRQHRQVASAFMTMRSRFDYCQGLKEAADSMCAKRDRNLARVAMERWKDAVESLLASRFYRRLLSLRTARTWLQFVDRLKAERQRDAEQHSKAVAHHNRKICRTVLEVLRQEVKVKQQLQRRRQRLAIKFATGWKRIADLSVTATIVVEERMYAKYWQCWRLAWVRRQAASREAALHRRQILSQVFTSWRNLCPSRTQLAAQYPTPNRRTARVASSESGRDSPTTPRSFLPVPVGNARRSASDC